MMARAPWVAGAHLYHKQLHTRWALSPRERKTLEPCIQDGMGPVDEEVALTWHAMRAVVTLRDRCTTTGRDVVRLPAQLSVSHYLHVGEHSHGRLRRRARSSAQGSLSHPPPMYLIAS